ncbi:hypothetical protein MK489_16080 [Myxococcota bacterium]|nr:hypothetical protein [Myxococcota bacterium]
MSNGESEFQLGDLGGVVRRRGKSMVWAVLLIVGIACVVAASLPNQYSSYSTILVQPQAVSKNIVTAGVGETDLTERLNIMTAEILSRSRLSKVIEEFDLYQEESKYMVRQDVIDIMINAVSIQPVVPELEQSQGMRRREAQINTFRIIFSYSDPRTAAEVANALANDFIEEHIKARVNQSQRSLDFMNTELERLAAQIESVEGQIAEIKAANRGSLPEDLPGNNNRVERLNNELAFAERTLADARSDEAFYRSQMSAAGLASAGDAATSPGRRLQILELLIAEYMSRGYTAKHPDVIQAQTEMANVRQGIKDGGENKEGRVNKSFAQQSVQAEIDRAQLRSSAAEEEIGRIRTRLTEVQDRLEQTPRVAERLEALDREYSHLFRSYQDFSGRRLEATTQAQLERRQLGEQLQILAQAFPASQPTSPNRPLIVILGFFFAFAIAGAAGIVIEASDNSIHTAHQIQAVIDAPILGSIPEIWLESDRSTQRRRIFRTAFGMVTVAFLFGVVSITSYWWVNGPMAESVVDVETTEAPAPSSAALPTVPGAAGN